MPQGLEIYDATGALMIGYTTRLTRVIAVIDPGFVDGSQSFPTEPNTLAAMLSDYSDVQNNGFAGGLPDVSVSGDTVSWVFNVPAQYRMTSRILVLGY
jgi:hypothetical protein